MNKLCKKCRVIKCPDKILYLSIIEILKRIEVRKCQEILNNLDTRR